jgi:hypothetical protein
MQGRTLVVALLGRRKALPLPRIIEVIQIIIIGTRGENV